MMRKRCDEQAFCLKKQIIPQIYDTRFHHCLLRKWPGGMCRRILQRPVS